MDSLKSKVEWFNDGEVVHSVFMSSSKVYFLQSGYVTASTIDDDGKKRIHLIYGPGDYFPILSIFNGTEQRATYETLVRSKVLSISADDFKHQLSTDLNFCNQILKKTVNQLAMFAERVIDLQTTKLSEKLLRKLKILAKDHGIKSADQYTLPYKLTHQHIAELLGVERESVSRNLTILKKQNKLIINKQGKIVISL